MTSLFLKIVNMSIAASWLVLAVLVLRRLLRTAPKWVNVLLWGIVAVRLICPFSIESALSLIPSAETFPEKVISGPSFQVQTGVSAVDVPLNDYLDDRYFEGVTVPANNGANVMTVLTVLWLLGMVLLAGYAAVSYHRLNRRVDTAVRLRENIFQSENVQSPFVLGMVKPMIYLPYDMDSQAMEYVIAHEQAHIHRWDHWWKPLGFLLLTVHWFNPLMWAAYILLCRDIELACDERVIRTLGNEQRADYTQALVACSVSQKMIAACPLAFGEVGVKERVRSIMKYKKPGFWIMVIAVTVCIAVAVCFLTNPKTGEENPYFEAEILEVYEGHFLVKPLEGYWEGNSSDVIEVPMENMEPSPEPEVGDIIRVEYSGLLQETYPARAYEVYHITIVEEAQQTAQRMINLEGILYLDTGTAMPVEIEPERIIGKLHTQVTGRPANNGQGNFDCEGCAYARIEEGIAVLIDNEWYLFTEEVLTSPRYLLTIGAEGVYNIQVTAGSRGSVTYKEDGTAYAVGETVLLDILTGRENLRGVTVKALDAEGNDLFSVQISAREYGAADDVIVCGDWIITPEE